MAAWIDVCLLRGILLGKLPHENWPGTNQRPFQACVGSRSYKDLMNCSWKPCICGVCCSPPTCRGCCITCRNWAAVLEVFSQFGNGKQWFLSLVWECLRYLMRDIAGYLIAGTDCKFPQFVDGPNWCGEVEKFAVILWCIVWKCGLCKGATKLKNRSPPCPFLRPQPLLSQQQGYSWECSHHNPTKPCNIAYYPTG